MSTQGHARRAMTVAALSTLALAIAACGSNDPVSDGPGPEGTPAVAGEPEVSELTVGVLPLADLAPFYLAIQEGLFEAEGLDVEPLVATGGAAQIAGVVAGDIDLTYSNYVSILQAAERGLPLQIVRENNRSGPQGIYTLPGSGIEEPADLAGGSISVNSLGNIQELTARAVLEHHGVDPQSLTFVELAPQDMPPALSAGHIDAAWLAEPFITLSTEESDAHRVVGAFEGPTEDLPVAGWAGTEAFVSQHPNTVAAFVRAMDAAMRLAVDEPDTVAAIIPTFTNISPEVAARLAAPGLAVESDLSDLYRLQDLMLGQGIIESELDLGHVVVE